MMMRRSNRSTIMPAGSPKTSQGRKASAPMTEMASGSRVSVVAMSGTAVRPSPSARLLNAAAVHSLPKSRPSGSLRARPAAVLGACRHVGRVARGVGVDRVGHRGSMPIAPRASAARRSAATSRLSLGGATVDGAAAPLETRAATNRSRADAARSSVRSNGVARVSDARSGDGGHDCPPSSGSGNTSARMVTGRTSSPV